MTQSRSTDPRGATCSETRLPSALTERLLDVLLDTSGVCAAFIVNDFGELIAARFAPGSTRGSGFAAALEAAAGLRAAAGSGLEPATAVIEFRLGLLFARRFRRSYLCVWATRSLKQRALEMSARLVAASLPPDARMDAAAAPKWDEDDQRPTQPWLPQGGAWPQPELGVSLRAPKLPRELVDTERSTAPGRQAPRPRAPSPSGIRTVGVEQQLQRQRARRR